MQQYWVVLLGTTIFILLLIFLSIKNKRQAIALALEKNKVSKVLDSQDSIVILSDGEKINTANQKFLEFFNIEGILEFTKEYDCICDKFEYEEGKDYIQKHHKGKIWNQYLKSFPEEIHKVKIKDAQDNFHIFKVNITPFDIKNSIDIMTLHDITDIESLAEENRKNTKLLHEQSKMVAMGEMIGNIAHQWRQPLSVISTSASGAQIQQEMGMLKEEQLQSTLETINNTAQQMSKTIDDFRDFLKGDSSKILFNLSEEIDKCLSIEEGILKQNNIKVIKTLDKTISINSLPHGLAQALVNIINNSKDAMKDISNQTQKLLFIEVKREEENVTITIKDSGGGIPENVINKVFEPYFTTKHQSQGTGLGLHMTYTIITQNMNGKIDVKNELYTYNNNEYKGASFIIELPST